MEESIRVLITSLLYHSITPAFAKATARQAITSQRLPYRISPQC